MSFAPLRHGGDDHHHDGNNTDTGGTNTPALTALRVSSIVFIFAIAAGVGLFVLRHGGKHRVTGSTRWYHVLLKYASPFTGGLFLALGLIHVFPEANEAVSAAFGDDVNDKYRLGASFATLAFLLLLFLEKFFAGPEDEGSTPSTSEAPSPLADASSATIAKQASDSAELLARRSDHLSAPPVTYNSIDATEGEVAASRASGVSSFSAARCSQRNDIDHVHKEDRSARGSIVDTAPHQSACRDVDAIQRSRRVEAAMVRASMLLEPGTRLGCAGDGAEAIAVVAASDYHAMREVGAVEVATRGVTPTTPISAAEAATLRGRTIKAIVLTVALSVHSLAEGMAMGLQKDVRDAAVISAAIFIHKGGASLAIGNSFALSPLSTWRCAVSIVIFSLATPLGIGLGWAATEFLPDKVNALLEAFTAGTFFFLACEVYGEEFAESSHNIGKKLLAFFIGLSLVYSVTVLAG